MPVPPGGEAEVEGPPGGFVALGLGRAVQAGLIGLALGGGAVLTGPGQAGWTAMHASAVALWALWLLWRNAREEVKVPGHLFQPFLAGAIVILLGHLLAGARVDAPNGHVSLMPAGDSRLLIRLMTLSLMVLLAQDGFSRIGDVRQLLTGLGAAVAAGCILRLNCAPSRGGEQAVAVVGLAGVGMLLGPCFLPPWPGRSSRVYRPAWANQAGLVGRIALAALLATLLIASHGRAASAAALSAGPVGAALLLSGALLPHHRRRLLVCGIVLAIGGTAALYRLSSGLPGWSGSITLLGAGAVAAPLDDAGVTGLRILGVSAGWVGLTCVASGMLAALLRSLHACRRAGPGDQARAALWSAVVALSGCALLCEGGLAIPAAAAVAAVAWGLMPHVMAHRVRRFHGWPVVVAFAAALVVLGLQEGPPGPRRLSEAIKAPDQPMHFIAGFVLAGLLVWLGRCRRWWQGFGAALAAAGVLILGEPLQERLSSRSSEWADAAWNALGAATALAAFLLVRLASWIENVLAARPRIPAEKLHAYNCPGGWRFSDEDSKPPARSRPAGGISPARASAGRRACSVRDAAAPARKEATPAPSPTAPGRCRPPRT